MAEVSHPIAAGDGDCGRCHSGGAIKAHAVAMGKRSSARRIETTHARLAFADAEAKKFRTRN